MGFPSGIPDGVTTAYKEFEISGESELLDLLHKLSRNPEHVQMWKTLERRSSCEDTLWVGAFLGSVRKAERLPAYYYISRRKRKALVTRIHKLTRDLVTLYKDNDLDAHLVHLNNKIRDGFFILDDFDETNQRRIESDGLNKLDALILLEHLANRASTEIQKANDGGKAGRNIRAIRFARKLLERNLLLYEKPLTEVVSIATNTLYETTYEKSDITNLINRLPRNQ